MTPNYDALQLSPLAVIITIVFYAAVYVWFSLALARVFSKQGIPGWKAWVPVYNAMTFMRLGGQSVIWVFLSVLPIVGLVSLVFFIMAINGVSKRFGKGAGFTVLGVFLYGIWVSILGFGTAQAVDPHAKPVYEPITKVPYGAPPIAQPPRPTIAAPTGAAPTVAAASPTPAPPTVPLAAPTPADAPTVAFISAPPITPPPSPAIQSSAADEHTVVVGRRTRQWVLEIDGGETVRLSSSTVLVGRNPSRDGHPQDAQLVSLTDPAKTVSKTHARLELLNGTWHIVDLDSTNGVFVISENEEREVQPGADAELTERFLLGELPVRIHQEF